MSKPKPDPEAPLPPFRLCNAFAKKYPDSPLLWPKCYHTLPHEIHEYFFRKLFPSRRGTFQELASIFYEKLYLECQAQGLVGQRAVWDKENEAVVAKILSKLNFNDNTELTNELNRLRAEVASHTATSTTLRSSIPDSSRSPRKRRAASRPDEPKR